MSLISTVSAPAVKSFGVFRVYKTRRFVVVFERYFDFWGDMQLHCAVYDRELYDAKDKPVIYRKPKGIYIMSDNNEDGAAKPIHALKHLHQRLKRNGLL